MRSPFPGMDPYLEEPGGWKGVHGRLIAVLGELLNRDLGPDFIADGDTRVYLVSPGEQHWIFPDVYIVEAPRPTLPSAHAPRWRAGRSPCQCGSAWCSPRLSSNHILRYATRQVARW